MKPATWPTPRPALLLLALVGGVSLACESMIGPLGSGAAGSGEPGAAGSGPGGSGDPGQAGTGGGAPQGSGGSGGGAGSPAGTVQIVDCP